MLNITDTKVRIVKKDDSKLKAIASIIIDDCFVIHDIKVIEDFVQRRPAYAKQQLMGWAGITEAKYDAYKAKAIEWWGVKGIHG